MEIGARVAFEPGPLTTGGARLYAEETAMPAGPTGPFDIDAHEVTNAQFAQFVAATGYVTVAERPGPDGRPLGAAIFDRTSASWRIAEDANWRQPLGAQAPRAPQFDRLPVVSVAYEDAVSYARWAGRRLPSEAEWEFAARGSEPAPEAVTGEAVGPDGAPLANTWQGVFPVLDAGEDGFAGAAPVGCFGANARGLYDMIGNVWEWTSDWYAEDVAPADRAHAIARDREGLGKRVIKGGSHLCAANFCARYRSRARQPGDPGLGTNHIGFRTAGGLTPATDAPPDGA